ncbi:hypothetical protein ACS3UN_06750 [Oscillospiraceae bacterium LTW-04]|nr:hypothetical protein RBH76_03610 [Oscillospiraceae bacterium MB24-C1]
MPKNQSAEIIALENHVLRVLFSTCGGHIEEIFDKTTGRSHAWKYSDSVWPRRTSVCFPICGMLPDNRYQYEGVDYEMNPHGFLREQIFVLENKDTTSATLLLTDSPSTQKVFPFRFHLRIRYTLQDDCLSVEYEVFNPSENQRLLFSIGSHYAYALPVSEGEQLEDYRLRLCGDLDAVRIRVVDGLQSGSGESVDVGPDIPVANLVDNRSIILSCNKSQTSRVTLVNTVSHSGTQVDFTGFEYCVLWAPYAGAPFICIEPWAGMTGKQSDSAMLEQKNDIQEVSPLASKHYSICIKPL